MQEVQVTASTMYKKLQRNERRPEVAAMNILFKTATDFKTLAR